MPDERLRVLVVDNEPSVLHALKILFDLHEIACETAQAPEAALRRIASGEIAVVIQDMNFTPGMTSGEEGIRLFRAIRERDPELPVLLVTAWVSLETAVQLVKEGACDYMAKPWDDDKLVTAVRNMLEMRRLQLENRELQQKGSRARRALAEKHDLCGMVYESEAMHRLVALALSVAGSDAPVLVTGPSGAGKEKLAEIVQANSRRKAGPFLRVNVGALPAELMESELFGAEPGAYTGAKGLRTGRFEAADKGTLFLDEIDALPLPGQVKLLRVVQSGEFQRLGSSKTRTADVRLISATNSPLRERVEEGTFREDLYYRLNVIELAVPPLSARLDDLLPLARHFLAQCEEEGRGARRLGAPAERALVGHDWGGNVRELQNRVRRAVLTAPDEEIRPEDLGLAAAEGAEAGGQSRLTASEEVERRTIEHALLEAEGVVSRAADALGVSRQALYRKMDRLGIVLERRPRP